jgi:hypothetical protein
MPSGSMSAGGYYNRAQSEPSKPSREMERGGSVPSLYEQMFGPTETREPPKSSQQMPRRELGKGQMPGGAMPGGALQSGPSVSEMPGAQETTQSAIEISGRWRLTLTPVA